MKMKCSAIFHVALVSALLLCLGAGLGCGGGANVRPKSEDNAQKHFHLAQLAFEQKRVEEAFREIEIAIKKDPKLPHVWFYRGFIYWSQEEWGKAEADFRTALERNPFFTDARLYLATCLEQRHLPEEALAELDRALSDKTFGTPEQVYINKAMILRRMGRFEEALAQLRIAAGIKPRQYRIHHDMALVFVDLGRYEEAALAFETAEPGYSRDPDFHLQRGGTFAKLKRVQEAQRELRMTIELSPGSELAVKAQKLLEELQ